MIRFRHSLAWPTFASSRVLRIITTHQARLNYMTTSKILLGSVVSKYQGAEQ